jgi:NAD(P)-dependent dehydrogenase (short-subunit alcohol dehydrogenase family)
VSERPFAGKTVVISGATGGIGEATAHLLAAQGADLILFGPSGSALMDLKTAVGDRWGARAVGVEGSVVSADDVQTVADLVDSTFDGRLDSLVNNAGVTHDLSPLADLPFAEWRRVLEVNLDGTFRMSQALLPALRASGAGAIVNVASFGGLTPFPKKGAYSVSKAGIHMLTQVMAVEEGPHNVRVNAIAPGPIETDMTTYLHAHPDVKQLVLQQIALGRLGTAQEAAELIVFLASEQARFLTGAVVPIGGGMLSLPQGPGSPYHVGG